MLGNDGQSNDPRIWSLLPPFRRVGATGWAVDLPSGLHGLTDNNEEPHRSLLRLSEDGTELGPPHAVHATIERKGQGNYSFWISVLYFSTSDGSDPNVNGRAYTVSEVAGSAAPTATTAPWTRPRRPIRCAVYGLGNRGWRLVKLASRYAGVEIAWVVDQSAGRVAESVAELGGDVRGTTDIAVPLADPAVDAIFVAVPDHLHRIIAEPAFRAGKHVFLEKPVATTIADAQAILAAWRGSGRILQLGYVLRQAPFYDAIRTVVRDNMLGAVRVAWLSEQLDVRHGASFMRRWHAQSAFSGGLMVHKGCHDLDIICWLLDAQPRVVSSFGGVSTFAGPPPAPFCSQCERRATCLHADIALHERRSSAEAADPSAYGLDICAYRDDKDIVDNQVVSFELDSGVRGTFHLSMQGPVRSERRIMLVGDDASLDGVFEDGRFTVTFTDPRQPPFKWSAGERSRGGHGGGDRIAVFEFLNACAGRSPAPVSSSRDAIRGLAFALAAERARTSGTIVHLDSDDFGGPQAG